MSDLNDASAADLPFRSHDDEPTDVPIANPDATAEADEDESEDERTFDGETDPNLPDL